VSRSFLFVPADSQRKLEKAASSNADALILDLEDSVAAAARPQARALAAEFLNKEYDGAAKTKRCR
jgi:citrate lyase subunit beta/citryl-CoA lyase